MATVKFYLKNPLVNGQLRKEEVSIFAKVTEGRENRFELRTGEKIEPKYWDFKSQQVKSTYRGHYEVNAMLQELKTKLLKLYRDNQNLSFAQFKALAQEKPSEKKTLFIALAHFNVESGNRYNSVIPPYNTPLFYYPEFQFAFLIKVTGIFSNAFSIV